MFNYARRINRATFFVGLALGIIGLIVIDIVQALIEAANDSFLHKNSALNLFQGIFILVGLLTVFIYIVGLVRQRANDIGWHPLLLTALAFWSPVMLLIGFLPGSGDANKFGTVPMRGIKLK